MYQTQAPYFHIVDCVTVDKQKYRISTIDLSHGGTLTILDEYRWETMVFCKGVDDTWIGGEIRYSRRYTSETQARSCHTHIVEKLVAGELELEGDDEE